MNDFDDLDDLFGQLRSAATDAELARETSHLDAIARHHRHQKGHTMFTSRRARVATFVAAGVIGFSGVAAAGHGDPFDLADLHVTTTSEAPTTTSEVPTTSEAPTTTSEVTTTTSEVPQDADAVIIQSFSEELPADEPETDECVGGGEYANHGEYVSAVAHADEGDLAEVEQRDAARSSCGKDAKDAEGLDDDDDELEKTEADEVDHDDDDGDHDDDSDDDENDDDEKSERSGKSESAGKQGNGSKKHSDD